MKSLSEYLIESKQTYTYRVRIADELADEFADKLERELGQFDLVKLSAAKKTPVQKNPKGFEGIENTEVNTFDVETNYPAAVTALVDMINKLGIPTNRLQVIAGEETEQQLEQGVLLTGALPEGDKEAGKEYGTAYQDQVKNADKSHVVFASNDIAKPAQTTNELPQGTKSAVGSTQNKMPEVKSFAR